MRVFALTFALVCLTGQARAAPLAAYGALPFIEQMKISPDGQRLAFVSTDGEARTVVVKDIGSNSFVGHINAGRRKIRDFLWAGDDHLIITASVSGAKYLMPDHTEFFTAIDYDLRHQVEHSLITPGAKGFSLIAGQPQVRIIDGKPMAFVRGYSPARPEEGYALYRVDLESARPPFAVDQGSRWTSRYVVDIDGRPLAQSEYDGAESQWALKFWHGVWVEAARQDAPLEAPVLLGLGRADRSVIVYFSEGDYGVIREYTADGKVVSGPFDLHGDFDMVWDATGRLMGLHELVGDRNRFTFLDPADAHRWSVIQKAFPGQTITFTSESADHKRFLVLADSGKESPAFYVVDMVTGQATWIADQYPALRPSDLSEVRPIAFQARDGLYLTGYLTLPSTVSSKPLPLVVLPHGGPGLRDEPGFDWFSQALASRGYAVLRVNFRGSSGFGRGFAAAGYGEWGRKMQSDLTDGLRYLASSKTIDPARVCVVGASYGGYAALAGATFDSGPYRCAVSIAGPVDPKKMIGYAMERSGDQRSRVRRIWARYLGSDAGLSDISPFDHASQAAIPILLIHGRDDSVVPYESSEAMFKALRAAGKSAEFLSLEGEDHWLSEGDTRLKALTATVAFLEKYNPPN
jgi:dipeptidyl aminopeptidase/acylaminoacyl peptidase